MRITFNRLFVLWMLMCPVVVCAATTPFSQYGVIQNVQNYSSNPFWNPNSPYNLRMPSAVYALGPNVETSDCQTIVATLVAEQCAQINNCRGAQLSDIRPNVMLQLSRIPNGNYATSCAGYLDTVFSEYVQKNANAVPSSPAAFPVSMGANPNVNTSGYQIKNPVTHNMPTWAVDMAERKQELQALQANDAPNAAEVYRAAFPKSEADLTFSQRVELAREGYEPYKDNKAYVSLNFESKEEYETRHEPKDKPDDGAEIAEVSDYERGPRQPTLNQKAKEIAEAILRALPDEE